MIVSEAGEYAGYVSNGCVDADIAGHALQALSDGKLRRVKYGDGSPYMDIRLPCGGGVSVVILPAPNAEIISEICGENLMMFARAAHSLGIDCAAYSPDAGDAVKIKALGGQAEGLVIGQAPDWDLDARTAVVTLFHDHDYEVPLLRKALESEAFYIGAMGSRTTHDARLMALREIDSSLKLSRLRRAFLRKKCVMLSAQ